MKKLLITFFLVSIALFASAEDQYTWNWHDGHLDNQGATDTSGDERWLKLDCSDDGLAGERQFLSPTDLTLHSAAQVINLSPTASVTGQLDAIAVTDSDWFDTDETALAVYGNYISPIDHHKAYFANGGWGTVNSGRLVDGTYTASTKNLDVLVSAAIVSLLVELKSLIICNGRVTLTLR